MKDYTHEVVTLWYRAPEILLGDNTYSTSIDIWAVGMIFYEMAHGNPFYYETSEIGVLFKIFRQHGTPTNDTWPNVEELKFYKSKFPKFKPQSRESDLKKFDDVAKDLFYKLTALIPGDRLTAKEALEHEYFKN